MGEEEKKEEPIQFKDVSESDWRGIVAIIVLVGGFIMLALGMILQLPVDAVVASMMLLTAYWYFQAKREENK